MKEDSEREKFIELNSLGLFPGPQETEDDYSNRAVYALSLKNLLGKELGNAIPFSGMPFAEEERLLTPLKITEKFYGIAPSWVPVIFSNYHLKPWQGGCAWIFQLTEDSPKASLIQLREQFRDKDHYLKIYDKDELLAHEFSHAGRLAYEEAKFEEFFAYRTSSSWFRKIFGPIVKSSTESLMFLIVLFVGLMLDLSAMSMDNERMYTIVLYSKLIPLALIFLALGRLFLRHRQLNHCFEKLNQTIEDVEKTNALLYRLTDSEIIYFSKADLAHIHAYIQDQRTKSFRWKFLYQVYFN